MIEIDISKWNHLYLFLWKNRAYDRAVWDRKLSSTVRKGGLYFPYPNRGEQAIEQGDSETSEAWFDQAANYWKQAIALAPNNYIEAQNWLKITGRLRD